jgi:phage gp46-like protein
MTDIATVFDPLLGAGDWTADGDLSGDLETAVLISVFTDRTAGDDDVIPDASGDPRGWWGDLDADRPIGSKLWLRLRSKQTDTVLALVRNDIADALAWLIDDGVAAAVDVTAEWTRPGMLGARIVIHRASGTTASFRYDWAWKEIA